MDVPQKQTCPQCRKAIDAHARICLFCNFRIRTRDAQLAAPLKFPPPVPQIPQAPPHPAPEKGASQPEIEPTGSPEPSSVASRAQSPTAETPSPVIETPEKRERVHLKLSLAADDVPDMPESDEDPDQPRALPRPRFTLPQLPPRAPELITLGERLRESTLLRVAMVAALMVGGFATGRLAVRSLMSSNRDSAASRVVDHRQPDLHAQPAAEQRRATPFAPVPDAPVLPEAMTPPILATREGARVENAARSEATIIPREQTPVPGAEASSQPARGERSIQAPRVDRQSRSTTSEDEESVPPKRVDRSVTRVRRTRAVPIERPLPELRSRRRGTIRLALLVGADGRVKEITVVRAVPGVTSQIIPAVQRWEFRPATLNGRPIAESFDVVLSF